MRCPLVCCVETDHAGSEKLLQQVERIVSCMGRSSILLKPHSALLVDSEPLTKFSVELVDDFTVTLAADCHCLATPFLKPVRSEKTMSCSHFGALQMFLTHLLSRLLAPENVIATVCSSIEVIMSLISEPNVIQPARWALQLLVQPLAHLNAPGLVLVLQDMVSGNPVREELQIIPHGAQQRGWWKA